MLFRVPAAAAIRRFGSDRTGSIFPIIAVMMTLLIGGVAFSTDYGSLFLARRRAQGVADLAAISAAQSPTGASAIVRRVLADNGLADVAFLDVQTGRYSSTDGSPPGSRFRVGQTPQNAAKVTVGTSLPLYFGRYFMGRDSLDITVMATASRADFAAISIGSRLVGLQGGVVNGLLGKMLGTQLSLTALDYTGLAGLKIDSFSMLDSMAGQLGLQHPTYSEVVARTVPVAVAVGAALDAAVASGAPYSSVSALRQVADAVRASPVALPAGALFDLGEVGGALAGAGARNPAVSVQALDLLFALGAMAQGSQQLQFDLGAQIAGVARTRLTAAIGERPAGGSWVSVGPVGQTVKTSQVRLLLEAWLTAPAGLAQVYVPIFVEVAGAEATLDGLTCPWSLPSQLGATIMAKPSAFDAAIAGVVASDVTASGPKPDLSRAAAMITLPLVSVTGTARATITNPAATRLSFSADDIASQRIQTVTTTGPVVSLASSLTSSASLGVNVLGIGIGLPVSTIRSTVAAALQAVAPALDGVLNSAFRTLGVGVGQADVWVGGVTCGRAVLVQ